VVQESSNGSRVDTILLLWHLIVAFDGLYTGSTSPKIIETKTNRCFDVIRACFLNSR
jgi:hypothetical protein